MKPNPYCCSYVIKFTSRLFLSIITSDYYLFELTREEQGVATYLGFSQISQQPVDTFYVV